MINAIKNQSFRPFIVATMALLMLISGVLAPVVVAQPMASGPPFLNVSRELSNPQNINLTSYRSVATTRFPTCSGCAARTDRHWVSARMINLLGFTIQGSSQIWGNGNTTARSPWVGSELARARGDWGSR